VKKTKLALGKSCSSACGKDVAQFVEKIKLGLGKVVAELVEKI
jgi:hypothetical protein